MIAIKMTITVQHSYEIIEININWRFVSREGKK